MCKRSSIDIFVVFIVCVVSICLGCSTAEAVCSCPDLLSCGQIILENGIGDSTTKGQPILMVWNTFVPIISAIVGVIVGGASTYKIQKARYAEELKLFDAKRTQERQSLMSGLKSEIQSVVKLVERQEYYARILEIHNKFGSDSHKPEYIMPRLIDPSWSPFEFVGKCCPIYYSSVEKVGELPAAVAHAISEFHVSFLGFIINIIDISSGIFDADEDALGRLSGDEIGDAYMAQDDLMDLFERQRRALRQIVQLWSDAKNLAESLAGAS